MAKYCSTCGAENRDTARFCQMCSLPLDGGSSGAICDRCGRSNRTNARFCQSCGASMAAQPARPASAPLGSLTGMLPSNMILHGRYIVATRVGRGGMGAVYKATDTRDKRMVAVKELSESSAATEAEREEARAAFRREAEILARLNHRNLPRVYDSFEESGKQYLVMDFVNGETLEQVLKRWPKGLPVNDVLKVADQLCDVLDYLHNRKKAVIFRDLKPGNIMIDDRGDVKLIDFGIARNFASGKRSDTTALGTAGYAPPEQYGKGQTDARSDVYALGATLHHLVTGIDPANSPFTFVSPRSVRPETPSELDRAIRKAVEQDPGNRWQTVRSMKQALHGVQEKPKVSAAEAPPKPQPARPLAPSRPAALPAAVPAAPAPSRSPAATPAAGERVAPRPAQPVPEYAGPLRFPSAVFLGLVTGAAVLFGRQVWGWAPQAGDFLQMAAWAAIFWFTGTVAYAIAKRPVAASAAWIVEPLWYFSGGSLLEVVLPVMYGLVLGWLMAIGGNRVTYPKLLAATVLTMMAEQAALMYFLNIPFRPEEAAGAVIGGSVAYVIGWAFRR